MLPQEESARLEALRRYEILDTPPDGAFDHITALAADLFGVPIAIVSLVDHDRIWFKSRHGLEDSQTARDPGLCASAILSPEVYHVRDAVHDARSLANPLVAGALGLRFYAAAPLRTRDGFLLGTICVTDREPRDLAPVRGGDAEEARGARHGPDGAAIDGEEARRAGTGRPRQERAAASGERGASAERGAVPRSLRRGPDCVRARGPRFPPDPGQPRRDARSWASSRTRLPTTYGKSFVPETPEAQRRMREAFESIGRGTDTGGVVLELRRKDNGKPLWIQWWSKPDPAGGFTRTMFIDITDRVLMEQEQARLKAQNEYLLEEIRSERDVGDIVGESPGSRKVMQQIRLVAPTDAPVLITGESGTGKELVARAIHENSRRKGRALVKVNCSAVPDSLFESEFFGHVRGAFTGALKDRPGRFELADGGTLFLDEIGEVPARDAGEAAARPAGAGARARRRHAHPQGRRAHHRRDQPRPRSRGRGRPLPPGPVLSPERVSHRDAAAARASRGHPGAGRAFREAVRPSDESPRPAAHGVRPEAARGLTTGPETSASSRTPSSAPLSCRAEARSISTWPNWSRPTGRAAVRCPSRSPPF